MAEDLAGFTEEGSAEEGSAAEGAISEGEAAVSAAVELPETGNLSSLNGMKRS